MKIYQHQIIQIMPPTRTQTEVYFTEVSKFSSIALMVDFESDAFTGEILCH
jgi:hypothetical protein